MFLSSGSSLWGRKDLRAPNVLPEREQCGLPPSLPTAELSLWPGWGCSLQGSVLLNSGVAGARVTPAPALTSPHSHGPPGQGPPLSACLAAQSTHKPSLPVLFVSHHRPSTVRSHNAWLWWKGPLTPSIGSRGIPDPLPITMAIAKEGCTFYLYVYLVSHICIYQINQSLLKYSCTYRRVQ